MKFARRLSTVKKNRLSGYLRRKKTANGRAILKRRRKKGRKRLTVV